MSLGTLAGLLLVPTTYAGTSVSSLVRVDRQYLRYGIWTAGWLAVATLFPLTERLILEHTRGIEAAGVYAAISDPLASIISAGTSVIGNALWPDFITAWGNNDSRLVRRLTAIGVLGSSAIGFLTALIGLLLVGLSAGRLAFLLSAETILAATMLFVTTLWASCVFAHKRLELTQHTRGMFLCLLGSIVVFLPLAFALAQYSGGLGIVAAKGAAGLVYLASIILTSRATQR